jgi:hypothetical protein
MRAHYITGDLIAGNTPVPRISTEWTLHDYLSTMRVRWAVGRMNYKVDPGLYAVGEPGRESPVLVTGNFKLTFDLVRRTLKDHHVWLLVLDTKGVNVWCAAGKGTFSTAELVKRIGLAGLSSVVDHRKVILPQLGATGVAAHEVKGQSGFTVIYGPVRVDDLPEFMRNGMKASPGMRQVRFPLWERIELIPVELSFGGYYLLLVPALFLILSGLNRHGYSINRAADDGVTAILNLAVAYVSGLVLAPALLPWIPLRRFALKGLVTGWACAIFLAIAGFLGTGPFEVASWFLMMGALSSFLAMNFTGSSTFTSLSGVQKEMKTALPLQIGMAGLGVIIWLTLRFF